MQLIATVLANVCFRIYADVRSSGTRKANNPAHHLHDLFVRRLKRGQCFRTPAMGWREFTCDYWGAFRDDYEVDISVNEIIPSMMHSVWSSPANGTYVPRFVQNVEIRRGVLDYAE
jgi:CRISPR-associated protein Cas5d